MGTEVNIQLLTYLVLCFLAFLTIVGDCIPLIREDGYRSNSHFYHNGDNGHAYHYSSDRGLAIYFKCVLYDEGCRGRGILRLGQGFRHASPHNHAPNPDLLEEREFRRNVLDRCRTQRWVSYKDILDNERGDARYSDRVRCKMTANRMRTSMRAARMKTYPDIPQTLRDLTRTLSKRKNRHISATLDKKDNMYAGSVTASDDTHHVIFVSKRMMKVMSDVQIIHADGTFRARPAVPHSSQLFVLVTTWHHSVIPLCWVLMEKRTKPGYKAIMKFLKHFIPDFNPRRITTDFEWPQQAAWEEEFPSAKVQGCLWHLCKAFVQKCKKLNLKQYFKHIPELVPSIRRVCAISLLPPQYFHLGLKVVKKCIEKKDIISCYLLQPFFKYVETKWLNNHFRNKWMSCYKSQHRTNNACESHHRILRHAVGAYRPNVYAFIEALARMENNAHLDILCSHRCGTPARSRRWTAVANDKLLKKLSKNLTMRYFLNRRRAVKNYVNRATNIMHRAISKFTSSV